MTSRHLMRTSFLNIEMSLAPAMILYKLICVALCIGKYLILLHVKLYAFISMKQELLCITIVTGNGFNESGFNTFVDMAKWRSHFQ